MMLVTLSAVVINVNSVSIYERGGGVGCGHNLSVSNASTGQTLVSTGSTTTMALGHMKYAKLKMVIYFLYD